MITALVSGLTHTSTATDSFASTAASSEFSAANIITLTTSDLCLSAAFSYCNAKLQHSGQQFFEYPASRTWSILQAIALGMLRALLCARPLQISWMMQPHVRIQRAARELTKQQGKILISSAQWEEVF